MILISAFTHTSVSRFRGQHLSREPPAGGAGVVDTDKNTWTKLLSYFFSSSSPNRAKKERATTYQSQISLQAPGFASWMTSTSQPQSEGHQQLRSSALVKINPLADQRQKLSLDPEVLQYSWSPQGCYLEKRDTPARVPLSVRCGGLQKFATETASQLARIALAISVDATFIFWWDRCAVVLACYSHSNKQTSIASIWGHFGVQLQARWWHYSRKYIFHGYIIPTLRKVEHCHDGQ